MFHEDNQKLRKENQNNMTKLNPDIYFLPIEIGTVLYQKTSDEIQMSLDGDITAIGEHEEPWVVEDIDVSNQKLKLFNLQTHRVYKMYFKELNYLIRHERIRISNEVA